MRRGTARVRYVSPFGGKPRSDQFIATHAVPKNDCGIQGRSLPLADAGQSPTSVNLLQNFEIFINFCGVQGRSSPLAGAGQSPAAMARFYRSRFGAAKSAQRAPICAPQGHALGGRSPTFNLADSIRVRWVKALTPGLWWIHRREKPIGRRCGLAPKSAPIRTSCVNRARCADAKNASACCEKRAKSNRLDFRVSAGRSRTVSHVPHGTQPASAFQ